MIEKHKKEKIPKSEYNDILQIFVIFFIAVPPTLFIIDFESGIILKPLLFKFCLQWKFLCCKIDLVSSRPSSPKIKLKERAF